MHQDCNTKFPMVGTRRTCETHGTNPPKMTPRKMIMINGKEAQFSMFASEPYRMYLYLLDKMDQNNLPVLNKLTKKWFQSKVPLKKRSTR